MTGSPSSSSAAAEKIDDAALERSQIADADVGDKERKERAGMREEQALAAVDPEEVGIQSSSLVGASTSVTECLPSRLSGLPVQRTTAGREPNLPVRLVAAV